MIKKKYLRQPVVWLVLLTAPIWMPLLAIVGCVFWVLHWAEDEIHT